MVLWVLLPLNYPKGFLSPQKILICEVATASLFLLRSKKKEKLWDQGITVLELT